MIVKWHYWVLKLKMGTRGFGGAGARPFSLSRTNSETNEILVENDQLQQAQYDQDKDFQLRNRSSTDLHNRSSNLCKKNIFLLTTSII